MIRQGWKISRKAPTPRSPASFRAREDWPVFIRAQALPSLVSVKVFVGRSGINRAAELFARTQGETQVRLRLEAPRDCR